MLLPFRVIYRLAVARAARTGKITDEQYATLVQPLTRKWRRRKTYEGVDPMLLIEAEVKGQMPKEGKPNWKAIFDWLIEHMDDILKIVLTILMFVEPVPEGVRK